MKITGNTKMCIIIGDPVEHSLSPAMHNAAYEAIGIDDQFVFTAARVDIKDIAKVVEAVRVMNIRGLTCTIPHKTAVMKYLDVIDDTAKKIGAVNTVVNDNGILKGYNTDWLGILTPLKRITNLANKRVAIIGAGGAARSMVYAMTTQGAQVKIFNRTLSKAQDISSEFQCEAASLENIDDIKSFDIIMNSTSVGMGDMENISPVPNQFISARHIVFDAVYVPYNTKLLQDAQDQGAKIIHGIDMLLYQGAAQFELYTEKQAPEETMKKVLYDYFELNK